MCTGHFTGLACDKCVHGWTGTKCDIGESALIIVFVLFISLAVSELWFNAPPTSRSCGDGTLVKPVKRQTKIAADDILVF